VFDFAQNWKGRFYLQKRVRVIYATKEEAIVVVTVFVYYGKWEL
jgi:hypothetical protein